MIAPIHSLANILQIPKKFNWTVAVTYVHIHTSPSSWPSNIWHDHETYPVSEPGQLVKVINTQRCRWGTIQVQWDLDGIQCCSCCLPADKGIALAHLQLGFDATRLHKNFALTLEACQTERACCRLSWCEHCFPCISQNVLEDIISNWATVSPRFVLLDLFLSNLLVTQYVR